MICMYPGFIWDCWYHFRLLLNDGNTPRATAIMAWQLGAGQSKGRWLGLSKRLFHPSWHYPEGYKAVGKRGRGWLLLLGWVSVRRCVGSHRLASTCCTIGRGLVSAWWVIVLWLYLYNCNCIFLFSFSLLIGVFYLIFCFVLLEGVSEWLMVFDCWVKL